MKYLNFIDINFSEEANFFLHKTLKNMVQEPAKQHE